MKEEIEYQEEQAELEAELEEDTLDDAAEMSFIEHLIELRSRLIKILLVVAGIFILLLPFYRRIYELFAYPVLNNLLPGQQMLAQQPIDVFLTPIKVSLFIVLLLAMPFILRQIWLFVAPAMYKREKRLMLPLLISALMIFVRSSAFSEKFLKS